jgi:tRNA-dihydrouridine synthase C
MQLDTEPIQLHLAPMEGVTDFVMRDTLTQIGGIDQCTTEFLRVTQTLHSHSLFYRFCPELRMGGRTRSGVPVYLQLLGGHPEPLASNAFRAAELGALGIDLNFGCPAKTVNRHDGGATLLKSTDRIYNIIKIVRQAVPSQIPVTAKIRLGFDDPSVCVENARAAQEAGASQLTVHCRTKTNGYKPPAYWEWIPRIKEKTTIPIVANGEIWSTDDFEKCRTQTQCTRFMIGRGSLRNPFLFSSIKHNERSLTANPHQLTPLDLLPGFFQACENNINGYFATSRTKQWLAQLRFTSDRARNLFDEIKVIKKPAEFKEKLHSLI